MPTADIWPALPENPSWIFVTALALVIGYFLLRAYTHNQQLQINGLRESLDRQAERHDREMQRMKDEFTEKVAKLEAYNEEARSDRHRLRGELGKALLAIDIIRNLQGNCTCGALHPLAGILDTFLTDFNDGRTG